MRCQVMVSVLAVLLSGAACAAPKRFDYCVHGFDVAFSQTIGVRLSADGLDGEEDARRLAGELVNRRVWERRARMVDVVPDQGMVCEGAASDRVTLVFSITSDDLSSLRRELDSPPPASGPTLDAVAERVTVSYLMSSAGEASVQRLRVFYATNRQDLGPQHKTARYAAERGQGLSYGTIDAGIKTEPTMKWLRALAVYRILPALRPDREVRVHEVTPLDLAAWRTELSSALRKPGRPGVLLFIHGYGVTFEDAAVRTAQLAADLAFEGVPMFFSWPSKGAPTLLNYIADKENARASASYLATLLEDLAGLPDSPPVYVIAHSMGNEVLVAALESMYRGDTTAFGGFREVVLAAPDIDAQRFAADQAKVIVRERPHVTLYASSADIALNISGYLQDVPRLGDTSRGLTIIPPMDTIDATAVKVDFLGHSYYGDNRTVVSDLFYLIRRELPPAERFGLERAETDKGGVYWKFK
jgi:esterase/lipase superfamily enzyme